MLLKLDRKYGFNRLYLNGEAKDLPIYVNPRLIYAAQIIYAGSYAEAEDAYYVSFTIENGQFYNSTPMTLSKAYELIEFISEASNG